VRILVGPSSCKQGWELGEFWARFAHRVAELDLDVLADCGRLVPGAPTLSLMEHADLTLLVARAEADSVLPVDHWLAAGLAAGTEARIAVIAVGNRRHAVSEFEQSLQGKAPVWFLAHDHRGAAALSGQPVSFGSLRRSRLIRCASSLPQLVRAFVFPRPQSPLRSVGQERHPASAEDTEDLEPRDRHKWAL
jgi:hypothetical protein